MFSNKDVGFYFIGSDFPLPKFKYNYDQNGIEHGKRYKKMFCPKI